MIKETINRRCQLAKTYFQHKETDQLLLNFYVLCIILSQYLQMLTPYTKPHLPYTEQLDRLIARGLNVSDRPKALFLLENISYYRLSGYWYPLLQDKENHTFYPHATFEQAFQHYCFDKELRKLVMSELEKIEVAVRSKIVYIMSRDYGAFWYQNNSLFIDEDKFNKTLQKMNEEFDRSDEKFVKAYKSKYISPAPCWILLEVASLGTLSQLYANLKPCQAKRDIAAYFGLADVVLKSWLHSLLYVRNICAHHARLWNKELQIYPKNPYSPRFQWLSQSSLKSINQKSTYMVLCQIRYMLMIVNPSTSFPEKIVRLFTRFPGINAAEIGFPNNWEGDIFWKVNHKINLISLEIVKSIRDGKFM